MKKLCDRNNTVVAFYSQVKNHDAQKISRRPDLIEPNALHKQRGRKKFYGCILQMKNLNYEKIRCLSEYFRFCMDVFRPQLW